MCLNLFDKFWKYHIAADIFVTYTTQGIKHHNIF